MILKNLKIKGKILVLLLTIALITASIVGVISFTIGKNSLEEESFKKLTAIREMKGNQIENYFQQIFDQVLSYSEDRMVIEATKDFSKGFNTLNQEMNLSEVELRKMDSILEVYYHYEFLNKLFYKDSTLNYYSISNDDFVKNKKLWLSKFQDELSNLDNENIFPSLNPENFSGSLELGGSSTVSSLVNHVIKEFKEEGAQVEFFYESIGTFEGIEKLIDGSIQLAGSSHELNAEEIQLFEEASLNPISFRIGTDALVLVAPKGNDFLDNVTIEELKEIFTTAVLWSDIRPEWPHEVISKFIPSEGSGSYELFMDVVIKNDTIKLGEFSNTTFIDDGEFMKKKMKENPFSIAFYSYNYHDSDSPLKILDLNGLELNNSNVSNQRYPLIRPLYLTATEAQFKSNKNISHFLNYFINSIESEIGTNLGDSEYWPQISNGRILQCKYIASSIYSNNEREISKDLFDQTAYSATHGLYHPIFKSFLDRFNYYDLFIIDVNGDILYSVNKEVDLGTNIINGPYNNSNLGKVFKKIIVSEDPLFIGFEDFEPYTPSFNAPASFIGSPIYEGGSKIGALVFQLPINNINKIMTDDYEWGKVGLGYSGETYLVGKDFLMRNQSRFLIEDPQNYFRLIEEMNLESEVVAKIKSLNTTIGLQPVITPGTEEAIRGETNTRSFLDYRGVEVMSAYKPLNIELVDWVIMSEIDKSEAYNPLYVLIETFLYWSILLIIVILILAIAFSNSISSPVQLLSERATELAKGNLDDPIVLEQNDEMGLLASNFEKMRLSVKSLIGELHDVNQNLENRVEQRTEELSSANNQIQGILDSILDAVIIINDRGIIVSCSPSTKTLFQYHEKELIGQNVKILMPSPHKEKHDGYLEKYKSSGVRKILGKERELMGKRKDGSSFPVRLMVNEVKTASGKLFVGLLGDLTERKKSELRLKLQSTALKSASNGVVITNSEGIITWVNPAFTKLTGYKWDELVGQTPRILKSGRHTEEFYSEIWSTVLRGDVWHGEIINKKSNGKLYYEEMTITPIRDEEDKIIQFVAIKNDISERKKAEDEIRRSEEFRRLLLNSTGEGIYGIDLDGNCTFANPSCLKLLGYDNQDELLGKNMHNLIHHTLPNGDPYIMQECQIYKAFNKGVDVHVDDEVFWRKDGTSFPVEYYSLPLRQDGEIVGSVLTFTDITERKRLEQILLNEKERMEKELNVARDIQLSMLPLIFPAFPNRREIDIFADLIAAREVGGDFYDFHFVDENHMYFVVGDVSGKGVPAALMMAVTKTLLKSRAGSDRSTASILTHVNNEIAKDNDAFMFITVFIGILDTTTGEMIYSNAGHNPSFIIKPDRELMKLSELHGPVIGAMEDMTYKESKITLNKDDIIFVYTDGVTEAQNSNEDFYSDLRLENYLKNGNYHDSRSLTKLIEDSVFEFQGEAKQFDDITLLAIKYLMDNQELPKIQKAVTIHNKIDQMPRVTEAFEKFSMQYKLPFGTTQKFNIALDELLNNIISYGYKDEMPHQIEVDFELRQHRLIITLKDDGVPFNPFRNDPPDTKLSLEERGVGGLGIHLVKNLVDEYDYKRDTGKNIISLIKYNINI